MGKRSLAKGSVFLYSGGDQHLRGVGLLLSKVAAQALLDWEPVNDRLIVARFQGRHCKITIIQCYAPTNEASDEDKDAFYDMLQARVSLVPNHDLLLVMGDLNAKVGSDNSGYEACMGNHSPGTRNDNGERFIEFCATNELVIGGSLFPHKEIHKLTWKSNDKKTLNQIDHITVNRRWRSALQDVKVHRPDNMGSDHFLLVGSVRLKLAPPKGKPCAKRIDVDKLKDPGICSKFSRSLADGLATRVLSTAKDVEGKWLLVKGAFTKSAEEVLGWKRNTKKPWISEKTWAKIEERTRLHVERLKTTTPNREQAEAAYEHACVEVKRFARHDKREFVNGLAKEAEEANAKNDLRKLYKVIKLLGGEKRGSSSAPVKNKDGKLLTTEREQMARWVEHFNGVLNMPEPNITAQPSARDNDLEISTDPPTLGEIKEAILAMKNWKAPGCDAITAEMLKADVDTTASALHCLFLEIWQKEQAPSDWLTGLIVKIPKKGDLTNCDNWRGITLLSIPSKVFCRVILCRIRDQVDRLLREEQAGFRSLRGCIDQIFALRNIVEQCLLWNSPALVNFVDFKKAFDSVHRKTLWQILRHYGIPDKIVRLIAMFYTGFECRVLMEAGVESESFAVNSGVRQGCILSPILFCVAIDFVMRAVTDGKHDGIRWMMFTQLHDLDFADDLALLATCSQHLQAKTTRLQTTAATIGLEINIAKTKVMRIATTDKKPISINDQVLEDVEAFPYLGSVISLDGAHADIASRLKKARHVFTSLKAVWRSKQLSKATKMRVFNATVKAVLLYGSECWRELGTDIRKLDAFYNRCLRRIQGIFWPRIVSNEELHRICKCRPLSADIRFRRLRWLGHVLRMDARRTPRVALRWTPQGKRAVGRPKITWRATIENDLRSMGMSWGSAQVLARDRDHWRRDCEEAVRPTRGLY